MVSGRAIVHSRRAENCVPGVRPGQPERLGGLASLFRENTENIDSMPDEMSDSDSPAGIANRGNGQARGARTRGFGRLAPPREQSERLAMLRIKNGAGRRAKFLRLEFIGNERPRSTIVL